MSLELYTPAVFAAADCEGHEVTVACDAVVVAADVASNAGSTSAAICDGRSTSPLPPVMTKVFVSVWQSVLFRPQTKVFVPASLEQGVIEMPVFGLSNT